MTAVDTGTQVTGRAAELAAQLVRWLETGAGQDGMFTPEVFVDLSLPHWRIQTRGDDAAYRLRADEHPFPGRLQVAALDGTDRGFLIQFEERWESGGQSWYCRELIHCLVTEGSISELVVYCTGDWDEAVQRRHVAEVRLLRP